MPGGTQMDLELCRLEMRQDAEVQHLMDVTRETTRRARRGQELADDDRTRSSNAGCQFGGQQLDGVRAQRGLETGDDDLDGLLHIAWMFDNQVERTELSERNFDAKLTPTDRRSFLQLGSQGVHGDLSSDDRPTEDVGDLAPDHSVGPCGTRPQAEPTRQRELQLVCPSTYGERALEIVPLDLRYEGFQIAPFE